MEDKYIELKCYSHFH